MDKGTVEQKERMDEQLYQSLKSLSRQAKGKCVLMDTDLKNYSSENGEMIEYNLGELLDYIADMIEN